MISLDIWVMVMIGFRRPEWKSLDSWKGMGKLVKTRQHTDSNQEVLRSDLEVRFFMMLGPQAVFFWFLNFRPPVLWLPYLKS